MFINKAPGFNYFFFFFFKELTKKTSHVLQGTMPTLADGTVAEIIMLNLVQEFLDRSFKFTDETDTIQTLQNTGDVF